MVRKTVRFFIGIALVMVSLKVIAGEKIPVLIVDGQNNHKNWPQTTKFMKEYLEETGLFTVETITTPEAGRDFSGFRPKFSRYKVVLLNYNGDDWPAAVQNDFEQYVQKGGGVVIVHAADNAFPNWKAFNEMIGLGGWGDRTEKSGPYVYFDEAKNTVVRDETPGKGGNHGKEHAFLVTTRKADHPIMKGLPTQWLHEKDELYDHLRGPAINMEVLATAYADPDQRGSGRHEPILMALKWGKGRIFHTTLGHGNYSQKCEGFIVTLQRGTEWAATGKVRQKVPAAFPGKDRVSLRP